jgi:hypothetical protein
MEQYLDSKKDSSFSESISGLFKVLRESNALTVNEVKFYSDGRFVAKIFTNGSEKIITISDGKTTLQITRGTSLRIRKVVTPESFGTPSGIVPEKFGILAMQKSPVGVISPSEKISKYF